MIIAIDGPSGTGKSTVARLIAERLKFDYLDSGAMYRSLAFQIAQQNIDPTDLERIEQLCEEFNFRSQFVDDVWHFYLGSEEVTQGIRTAEVTEIASKIASYPFVRKAMAALQRRHGEMGNIVCEGPDIGTVIFPHAQLKIFLTASVDTRARRRLEEMRIKFPDDDHSFEQIKDSIIQRDSFDMNRDLAPLKLAEDAIEVDTSNMTIDQVVNTIINMISG